jgi:hypothetical protein
MPNLAWQPSLTDADDLRLRSVRVHSMLDRRADLLATSASLAAAIAVRFRLLEPVAASRLSK